MLLNKIHLVKLYKTKNRTFYNTIVTAAVFDIEKIQAIFLILRKANTI